MHESGRSLTKAERQRLIESLISRKGIGTQRDLLAALAAEGCRVTQATVSRDIADLGLEKARDPLGHRRYVLPERARRAPRETLQAVLGQFGHRAVAAQNIVVVVAELGSAPTIARAIDQLQHAKVVGTLAGDDTCLVIARDARDAKTLAAELVRLLERG